MRKEGNAWVVRQQGRVHVARAPGVVKAVGSSTWCMHAIQDVATRVLSGVGMCAPRGWVHGGWFQWGTARARSSLD
jgi:hypothetical protein